MIIKISKLTLSVSILFFFFSFQSCETTEVELVEAESVENTFILPVTIKGQTYNFIFDTGAYKSVIDYKLAKELGYDGTGVKYQDITRVREIYSDTICLQAIEFSIGGIDLKTEFILDGYKTYMASYREDMVGVIGQDIISKYNWLFDFQHKKVTISNTAIELPDDEVLKLKFDLNGGNSHVAIELNNHSTYRFVFDTGYAAGKIRYTNLAMRDSAYVVYPNFVFSDSLYRLLNKKFPNNMDIGNSKNAKLMVLDSLQLDEFKWHSLSATHESDHLFDGKDGYITANFAYRFRQMFYNSRDKEISFYLSPEDSTHIYTGQGEREFIDRFIELLKIQYNIK